MAVAAERLDQGELDAWQKIWDHWDLGNKTIYRNFTNKLLHKSCRGNPCESELCSRIRYNTNDFGFQ